MTELKGFRVRLEPTAAQRGLLVSHAGAARWAYNWGLEVTEAARAHAGVSLGPISLHKLLNSLKGSVYPWLYEVSKCAPQEALRDLGAAYQRCWAGQARRPSFKSRARDGIGGFRLTGHIHVGQNYVQLPRIGRVRLSETDRLPCGRLEQITVREHGGHWFVSANVPASVPVAHGQRPRRSVPLGVDLGINASAVLSTGERVAGPRAYARALRKLRRSQRALSRCQFGSRNRGKARATVARQHARVRNQRQDFLHKLTTELATRSSVVVIEDLNVSGMSKNHALARRILDEGWGEFRRQLTYKCEWYGTGLLLAPRFFPSSQTCSGCGARRKLTLAERSYGCEACGLVIDRDENAARVLAGLGTDVCEVLVAARCAETLNACGASSAGPGFGSGGTARGESGTVNEAEIGGSRWRTSVGGV